MVIVFSLTHDDIRLNMGAYATVAEAAFTRDYVHFMQSVAAREALTLDEFADEHTCALAYTPMWERLEVESVDVAARLAEAAQV